MALKKIGKGGGAGGGGWGRNAITLICRGKHVRNRYLTEFAHTGSTTKLADSVTCILTLIRTLLFYWLTISRDAAYYIGWK